MLFKSKFTSNSFLSALRQMQVLRMNIFQQGTAAETIPHTGSSLRETIFTEKRSDAWEIMEI